MRVFKMENLTPQYKVQKILGTVQKPCTLWFRRCQKTAKVLLLRMKVRDNSVHPYEIIFVGGDDDNNALRNALSRIKRCKEEGRIPIKVLEPLRNKGVKHLCRPCQRCKSCEARRKEIQERQTLWNLLSKPCLGDRSVFDSRHQKIYSKILDHLALTPHLLSR